MYTQIKKIKQTLIYLLASSSICLAGFNLKLNIQTPLCDQNNVVQPNIVAGLTVGTLVKLARADGTVYCGKITESEESPDSLKIKGEGSVPGEFYFGFTLAKGGVFAGAILDKSSSEEKVYVLEFSPAHKGYIFIFSSKHNKQRA